MWLFYHTLSTHSGWAWINRFITLCSPIHIYIVFCLSTKVFWTVMLVPICSNNHLLLPLPQDKRCIFPTPTYTHRPVLTNPSHPSFFSWLAAELKHRSIHIYPNNLEWTRICSIDHRFQHSMHPPVYYTLPLHPPSFTLPIPPYPLALLLSRHHYTTTRLYSQSIFWVG